MADSPKRLRDLLSAFGDRLGMSDPVRTGALWTRWREIVGDQMADHVEPTSLREGVLRVRAESPTWATEVGYLAEDLKARINAALASPAVREVRVWIGPAPAKARRRHPVEPERKRDQRPPPADLSEAFERARKAWSERRQTGQNDGPRNQESPW